VAGGVTYNKQLAKDVVSHDAVHLVQSRHRDFDLAYMMAVASDS
jgi:hypothetical protein